MRYLSLLLLFVVSLSAFAKDHSSYVYEHAVLDGWRTVTIGSRCDIDSSGFIDQNDRAHMSGDGRCRNRYERIYSVVVGDRRYEVSAKRSMIPLKSSPMSSLAVGSELLVRLEGSSLYLQYGNGKEWKYFILAVSSR